MVQNDGGEDEKNEIGRTRNEHMHGKSENIPPEYITNFHMLYDIAQGEVNTKTAKQNSNTKFVFHVSKSKSKIHTYSNRFAKKTHKNVCRPTYITTHKT